MSAQNVFVCALVVALIASWQPLAYGQSQAGSTGSTFSPSLAKQDIQPSFITLNLTDTTSIDIEVIQWPDGSFSIPVKTLSAFLGISIQQSDEDQRLFYVDPGTQQKVDIYWGQQRILVNDQALKPGIHPMVRSQKGLLIKDDIYLDQAVFSTLFQVNFKFDKDATALSLSTTRPLKLPQADGTTENLNGTDDTTQIIRNPVLSTRLIEKVYIRHNSNYGYQTSQQPVGLQNRLQNTNFNSLMDTSTLGASGTVFGLNYYVKPSFIRYNNKTNLQQIDWSLQREVKGHLISLGNTDAGLSTLTSPTLNVWGLKFASPNALTSGLSPKASYDFSGKAGNGNQVTIRINNRTTQTVTAKADSYEFEPVYLQPQTINHIQIVEKDSQNQERVLLDKTVGAFANLLPQGEAGYSAFFGRVPMKFYPLIPDQKTPILMPQSEKWLTGGRLFYGLSNRLTVGISGMADQIFGKPKTYYTSLNPLSVDLTGFSSYQRDPNFFSGENLSMTLRYQLTDRWLASTDFGISCMNLKPGTELSIPDRASDKAAQVHLERQGSLMSWYADGFRYDPYYYTPTSMFYGNTLYDKQGLTTGVNGTVSTRLAIHYNLNWSHYQTNLQHLIPGGLINANRWGGSLSTQLNSKNMLMTNFGWVDGTNHDRQFLQKSLDLTWRTQSLPWRMQGEVRASHYFTNTLLYPSKTLIANLIETPYQNNILETALDIPLSKKGKSHIKIGNRLSSFVDYGYVQGFFQFKRFFIEPLVQISYGDRPQLQNRFGMRLGYQLASGTQVSISLYRFKSTFQPLRGAVSPSHTLTHQLYFDFSDILGLLASHARSLGPNGDSMGMIFGTLFADYHANGKWDKGEPGVKGIKMLIDKQRMVTTDLKGNYWLSGLSGGYHTIEILPNDLPLTLNADNPIYKVKVREGKTHRLDIALKHEGGTLGGHLALNDLDGKSIPIKNMTLVLMASNGTVLKYTAVDENGNYKFSNIPSGEYQIDLESKIKGSGLYKALEIPPKITLAIPKRYEESLEIKNLNFKVLSL